MSEFRSRILMPFVVPVLGLVIAGVFVFAFSRVLLAVPKYWSVTLAGVVAAEILGIAAVIAAVRRITGAQRAIVGLLGVIVLIGGGVGAASGIRPIEGHREAIQIVAEEIEFTESEVHVPADHGFVIEFVNNDANIQHNVAIYTDESATEDLFIGETFPGIATREYDVPALPADEYFFRCDVHPLMAGTMIAEGEDGAHGGGEPGPEPTGDVEPDATVAARNFEFDTEEVVLPAGEEVHLAFANEDAGVPHNVAIYTDDTFAEAIFTGATFNGVKTEIYTFTAPPPGEYPFRCDLHPPMQGTLVTE